MRIVIDLQGAQSTGSRTRGIGRYSLGLTKGLLRLRGAHEVLIALSDQFPETIEPLRVEFEGLVPPQNIRVWRALNRVAECDPSNAARRRAAELLRECFLASLAPDFVIVTSLFEGFADDAVTSIGRLSMSVPTAVVLYDLIPHLYPDPYLLNTGLRSWYHGKLAHLRRANLILAISESSRQEGIDHLGFEVERCVTISTAAELHYRPLEIPPKTRAEVLGRYGLTKSFVMYTGGIDHRKNIEGLIRAFALLPREILASHQLAIVCAANETDRQRLLSVGAEHNLEEGQLKLTGFVPEADLLALYNLCTLFVFPSWHEGFGLPALEAMRCGCAVIGSNRSSLPEVIGREDALFNPFDDTDIARLIGRVLSDDSFRIDLASSGLIRSRGFSWDAVATRALAAIEATFDEASAHVAPQIADWRRPTLAFVSPLPPAQSGISDYSAALLPELARHYEIEVITSEGAVTSDSVPPHCAIRSIEWFRRNAHRYDRVLYQFGNSEFHQHMFDLVARTRGVVVLHDFYLSGVVAYMESNGGSLGDWARELQRAHGYKAAQERYKAANTADLVYRYPTNLMPLQAASGVIVHSGISLRLADEWLPRNPLQEWHLVPLLRTWSPAKREKARDRLGIAEGEMLVCSFGHVGPTKLSRNLIEAWLLSKLGNQPHAKLVFVGQCPDSSYGKEILRLVGRDSSGCLSVTGWADSNTYDEYLSATDLAVQLRTLSRGETSAAVLDCMGRAVATIVNANGSMSDLPDDGVYKLDDNFDLQQLADALDWLGDNGEARAELGRKAREYVSRDHQPRKCARLYRDAIEASYASLKTESELFKKLGREAARLSPDDLIQIARSVSWNHPIRLRRRQLLVDVSEMVCCDYKLTRHRVGRSILQHWLQHPPVGWQVEPISATAGEAGYRYARQFTMRFLGCPDAGFVDEPVEACADDVYIALASQPELQAEQAAWLMALKRGGVRLHFVVYDLARLTRPEEFPSDGHAPFDDWFRLVAASDGVHAISKYGADQLLACLQSSGVERHRPLAIDWFPLGSDIAASLPSVGFPAQWQKIKLGLSARRSFLMVGTLEPSKRHGQVLAAFEALWAAGHELNLVIVGKSGWLVDELLIRLSGHSELGNRLWWLDGLSDEALVAVYEKCECLIAASVDDGFGLPLLEAASHRLHLLVRDIAVFREVTNDSANFFEGEEAVDLERALLGWLHNHDLPSRSSATVAHLPTWAQSAAQLMGQVLGHSRRQIWLSDQVMRYRGYDRRLFTQVGVRRGGNLSSCGESGALVHGPYIALGPGRYEVVLHLADGALGRGAWMDVTVRKGVSVLAKRELTASGSDETPSTIMVPFVLPHPCSDLEVRVFVSADTRMSLAMIEIRPQTHGRSLVDIADEEFAA